MNVFFFVSMASQQHIKGRINTPTIANIFFILEIRGRIPNLHICSLSWRLHFFQKRITDEDGSFEVRVLSNVRTPDISVTTFSHQQGAGDTKVNNPALIMYFPVIILY